VTDNKFEAVSEPVYDYPPQPAKQDDYPEERAK
jgi:hypothetical protein